MGRRCRARPAGFPARAWSNSRRLRTAGELHGVHANTPRMALDRGSLRRAQQRLRIAPLIQKLGLLALGLLEMGVLDVAVALDVRRHRGELDGERMVGRAQAG